MFYIKYLNGNLSIAKQPDSKPPSLISKFSALPVPTTSETYYSLLLQTKTWVLMQIHKAQMLPRNQVWLSLCSLLREQFKSKKKKIFLCSMWNI